LRCTSTVRDAFGNDKTLPLAQLDCPSFQVDEQFSFQDEKEFVQIVVLVPVVLPFDDPEPHDRIVDLAQRLIVPAVANGIDERRHIDDLERRIFYVEMRRVRVIRGHG